MALRLSRSRPDLEEDITMPVTVSSSTVEFTTVFSETERLALGGFLAGYSGQTRDYIPARR